MPRYKTPPLTAAAVWQDGPPVRMRDLAAMTGLTAQTIRGDIRLGHLPAVRHGNAGYYLFPRPAARAWLRALGFEPAA
jgi:hypothetical protein